MANGDRPRPTPDRRCLAAAALLLSGLPPAAQAAPCVRTEIPVPILAIDGAVVVPVTVDGIEAAAELAPHASVTTVIDQNGLHLPVRGAVALSELFGTTTGAAVRLRSLTLGGATATDLDAVAVSRVRLPPVNGRRIMLQLGADILDGYLLLLDPPNRRLLLFADRGPACPDPARLLPGHPVSVPLDDDPGGAIDLVTLFLDGRPVRAAINLSSNDSIVTAADAARAGVSARALSADPKVRTGFAIAAIGRRHRFRELRLGRLPLSPARIDVQDDVAYDVLGLDVFRNRVTLFDFPGHRLLVGPAAAGADPDPAPRAATLSTVATRNADATVETPPARR